MDDFRQKARRCGIDVIELADPLSFEAVAKHIKDAFDKTVPLFVVYAKNAAKWTRGEGFAGDDWRIAASNWTEAWLRHGYRGGREWLEIPRRGAIVRAGSVLDDARRRGRALLFRTWDNHRSGDVEVVVIMRTRSYGKAVAQVFVVGVERTHAELLRPQIELVAPAERSGSFTQVF